MQVQAGFRATHGIGNRLWQSHGVVSHASNTSLTDKEAERDTAGNTFIQACSTLIKVLSSYQNAYINTDQGSARRISNWV